MVLRRRLQVARWGLIEENSEETNSAISAGNTIYLDDVSLEEVI